MNLNFLYLNIVKINFNNYDVCICEKNWIISIL